MHQFLNLRFIDRSVVQMFECVCVCVFCFDHFLLLLLNFLLCCLKPVLPHPFLTSPPGSQQSVRSSGATSGFSGGQENERGLYCQQVLEYLQGFCLRISDKNKCKQWWKNVVYMQLPRSWNRALCVRADFIPKKMIMAFSSNILA